MPEFIAAPATIEAAGTKPKLIEEYAGRVRSGHEPVSVARMKSPEGWVEPGQRPEFEEITVVLGGLLRVEHENGVMDVRAGEAVVSKPGEWVRYSSPETGGAEYARDMAGGLAFYFMHQGIIMRFLSARSAHPVKEVLDLDKVRAPMIFLCLYKGKAT